ncbi:hypothetical protein [Sessilibacter corallicola]|uniref:Uncharacterized protein n=1 Tax=Sessilibacter corallicola TaxID=2904075 RepID=A0ABQ0AA26_9GAMM|nr:hypothetical protein [Sessilibacter corallicola]MCE2029191.1 hypothetical protein [Sessilibacter corallicola]
MEFESFVYGCIVDTRRKDPVRRQTNRAAMQSLPTSDDWQFLAREMFSLPEIKQLDEGPINNEVVHFGASYRGIEYEWQSWIAQFEQLLGKMYWVSAKVHLETVMSGTHTFTWETSGDYHEPGSGDMQVQCEWSREDVF